MFKERTAKGYPDGKNSKNENNGVNELQDVLTDESDGKAADRRNADVLTF